MNKHISIYVRNSEDGPSCYYRICQYIKSISESDGFEFTIHDALSRKDFRNNLDQKNGLKKRLLQLILFFRIVIRRVSSINSDLTNSPTFIIIQREVFPRYLPFFVKNKYKKLLQSNHIIWDFDDDILESKELSKAEWDLLIKNANTIVATSNYLINKTLDSKATKIALPTTDGFFKAYDYNLCLEKRRKEYDSIIHIVWVGTASNLANIVGVIPYIESVSISLKGTKRIELVVISNVDDPAFYKKYDNLNITYKKWSREIAEHAIVNAHIGVMPLPNTINSKGKGGFKLIQYMSAGVPVIASKIGMNCDIVTPDMGFLVNNEQEWIDAMITLSGNISLWEEYSYAAKQRYESHFSFDCALNTWRNILK